MSTYTCVLVSVCISVGERAWACVWMYECVCECVHKCVCECAWACVCRYECVCVCVFTLCPLRTSHWSLHRKLALCVSVSPTPLTAGSLTSAEAAFSPVNMNTWTGMSWTALCEFQRTQMLFCRIKDTGGSLNIATKLPEMRRVWKATTKECRCFLTDSHCPKRILEISYQDLRRKKKERKRNMFVIPATL